MGLDITSYEHVALVEEVHALEDSEGNYCGDPEEYGGQDHVRVYSPDFPDSLGSLQHDKCYLATGDTFGFRAGSYSGHGQFRAALCEAALGVPPENVWEDPDEFRGKPFYELINFSDCEGAIGPEVCAKLAADFQRERAVRDALEAKDLPGDWYVQKFDDWQRAFELAADTGLVQFH